MEKLELEEFIKENMDFVKAQSLIKFLNKNDMMGDLSDIFDKHFEENIDGELVRLHEAGDINLGV